jgi:hypothetical protein
VGDVPAAVRLELVIDERVHRADVHGELEALPASAHRVGLRHGHRPLLRLGKAAYGFAARQPARLDEQVGGTAEAVAADQGQLQHDVRGVGPQPAVRRGPFVDEVEVHPRRDAFDGGEELAQRSWTVRDGVRAEVEGLAELSHGDPVRIVDIRDVHRRNQSRAHLVAMHEPLPDPVDELLIGAHGLGQNPERPTEAAVAPGRLHEPAGVCGGHVVCEHGPMLTRAIIRVQFAF